MLGVPLQEYDLIGYRIVSPFHLMALTAFAQHFQMEKKSLNLLVIVSKGPWEKNIIKRSSISDPRLNVTFMNEKEAELEFLALWPLFLMLRPFFSWGKKVIGCNQIPVCAPTLSCLKFSSRSLSALWHFQPILIDEGIGSFNTLHNFRQEASKKFHRKWIQRFAILGFRLVYSSLRLLGGNRITLFTFRRTKPVLNPDVAEAYRRVFKKGYEKRNKSLELDRPIAIILTQPFSEMGLCSASEFMNEVEELIGKIRQMNLEPALKVHPAEDVAKYSKLDVDRVDYDGPVEELFAAAGKNIVEIWGFTSTSLITGSALFGIPSRRVNLPWPGSNADFFEGEARELFLTYTETVVRE